MGRQFGESLYGRRFAPQGATRTGPGSRLIVKGGTRWKGVVASTLALSCEATVRTVFHELTASRDTAYRQISRGVTFGANTQQEHDIATWKNISMQTNEWFSQNNKARTQRTTKMKQSACFYEAKENKID